MHLSQNVKERGVPLSLPIQVTQTKNACINRLSPLPLSHTAKAQEADNSGAGDKIKPQFSSDSGNDPLSLFSLFSL